MQLSVAHQTSLDTLRAPERNKSVIFGIDDCSCFAKIKDLFQKFCES